MEGLNISEIVNEIIVERRKAVDDAILVEIQQIATENGFKTEVILNETAIVKAIRNYTPIKPTARTHCYPEGQYECSACRCGLVANKKWKQKYCPECGQAVDWSDTE